MNWLLVGAGALMLAGSGLHFAAGDKALRGLGGLALPPSRFGKPADAAVALRVTWHFGTIAFAFVGAWLVATGLNPGADFAVGVTYLSATLLSFYGLLALGVRIYRHGFRAFFKHPGPLILVTAAVLVWWGSISL